MAVLTFTLPGGSETRLEVGTGIVVGSGDEAGVQVAGLSPRHARFYELEGQLWVEPTRPNGTSLDGRAIDSPTPIAEQSEIWMGPVKVAVEGAPLPVAYSADEALLPSAAASGPELEASIDRSPRTKALRRRDLTYDEEMAFFEAATTIARRYQWVRGAFLVPATLVGLVLTGVVLTWNLDSRAGTSHLGDSLWPVGLGCWVGWRWANGLATAWARRAQPRVVAKACAALSAESRARVERILGDVAVRLKAGVDVSDEDLSREMLE